MSHDDYRIISADIVILGGGGAGMRAAIAAAGQGLRIAVLTKGQAGRSGATPMACPSYQAAFAMEDKRDSPEVAFEDTCFEGRYLGDENLIHALTHEATDRAMDMLRYGVKFRRKENGNFLQVLHPGHSYERNLVIQGNGFAMAAGLRAQMLRHPDVTLYEDVVVTRLLKDGNRIAGLVALDMRRGQAVAFQAPAVVVATGGYSELWRWTDAEPGLTGGGAYQSYLAGADLVDLEMMLFYPTGLCYPTEVEGTLVQYEGLMTDKYCHGVMLNGRGEPFLPQTERLPVRDVMMKLIFREIEEGRASPHGGVYIDLARSPKPPAEIMKILVQLDSLPYHQLSDLGVDVLREPIEVMPVTHYTLGGVRINEWAETAVPGLFAAGEVTGNVHGANRTSGNALAETQVFGARAGARASQYVRSAPEPKAAPPEIQAEIQRIYSFLSQRQHGLRPIELKRKVKAIMHEHVNYRRDAEGLQAARNALQRLREEDVTRVRAVGGPLIFNYEWEEALEVVDMVDLAEMVAAAALGREESRGHHWRTDFPHTRPEWEKHTVVRSGETGYQVASAPVIRMKDRTKERRLADPALIAVGVLDESVGA